MPSSPSRRRAVAAPCLAAAALALPTLAAAQARPFGSWNVFDGDGSDSIPVPHHPALDPAPAVTDTDAFDTCP